MQILVDADALPGDAKAILFRAAERLRVFLVLVANKPLKVPHSAYLSSVVVGAGADIADDWIVERVQLQDLVITADIPLASRVVAKGANALDPRGDLYSEQNVKEKLALRDLLSDLRGCDMLVGGGPATYTKKDSQKFACQLDSYLSRHAPPRS